MFVLLAVLPLLLSFHLVAGLGNCPDREDIFPCKCTSGRWDYSDIEIDCIAVNAADVVAIFSKLKDKMLRTVTLRSVKNGNLPSNLFSNVNGVQDIIVDKCDMEGLADGSQKMPFVGLENSLESLTITNSFKGDMNDSLNLAHLKRLNHLFLGNNNIPEIRNDWFENGPISLKELTIASCGVRSLGDTAFQTLVNLEELNIHDNPIGTFSRTMFPPRGIRNSLVLWKVGLTNPPSDLFLDMPHLKGLNLRDNAITRLSSDVFSPVWEQLSVLNLKENPIICDDHMDWLLKLRRPLFLAGYCESPSEQSGKGVERFIDDRKREVEQK